MSLTLEEIIQDLRALEARLRAHERKYGITSQDFYSLYREGLLDDEGFEQSIEFTRCSLPDTFYNRAQKPGF